MVFYWQTRDPSIVDHGASSSIGLFSHGEWWRPFTSLFLHADLQHLLGNILSGMLFGTLVSRSLGPWRGWALILASGVLGNILTCLLNYQEHFVSIGASTAVFGALGILSGIGLSSMRRSGPHLPLARTTAPLIAGIILLGWLGVGQSGDNTDVLGHVMGFCSGLAVGLICDRMTPAAEAGKHPPTQPHIG
jgi:membrane associated rhomboid family serine protease